MTEGLSESELVNAYADGELPEAQRRRMEMRLRAQPSLQEEVDRIRAIKAALAGPRLRAARGRRQFIWAGSGRAGSGRAGVAIAACLVLAGWLALFASPPTSESHWVQDATNLHGLLSDRPYSVDPSQRLLVVSGDEWQRFNAPDLSVSRLYLVAAIAAPGQSTADVVLHYRGVNGCSLTISAFPGAGFPGWADPPPPTEGVQRRTWTIDGIGFAVVATRMDPTRFDTAARYAEAEIRKQVRRLPKLQTAMRASAAHPCV